MPLTDEEQRLLDDIECNYGLDTATEPTPKARKRSNERMLWWPFHGPSKASRDFPFALRVKAVIFVIVMMATPSRLIQATAIRRPTIREYWREHSWPQVALIILGVALILAAAALYFAWKISHHGRLGTGPIV